MRTCGRLCIDGSLKAKFETYDLQYQPHASGPLKTVAGTDGWGISTSSKNPEQAWEVVKLLSDSAGGGGNLSEQSPGSVVGRWRQSLHALVYALFPTYVNLFSGLDHNGFVGGGLAFLVDA